MPWYIRRWRGWGRTGSGELEQQQQQQQQHVGGRGLVRRCGMGHGCAGCGSCDSRPWRRGYGTLTCWRPVLQPRPWFRQPQPSPTPTAVLCLGQAVASQPIEAAAVGVTIEYCALIDVVVVPSIAHLAVITAAATPSPITLGNSILGPRVLWSV